MSEMEAELVLLEEQAPQTLIETLEKAGYAVAKLNTMSTMTETDSAAGYFDALDRNAEAVAEACRSIQR